MANDEELIEQIRHGQREVYAELFRKYYTRIYAICLSILRNPQDAEEIAQEIFVHAYLKLNQLQKPSRFFPWLKTIARNQSRNHAQRRETGIIPLDLTTAHKAHAAPDEWLLRQELIDTVMEAIETLPTRDREVIRARIDGLNHAEISEKFGISVQSSMSQLYRARKKLSTQVKDLLHIVFSLPEMLPIRKLISGGVIAMKIGTSTKLTIGILGILAAGFIGFQVVTRQPDVVEVKTERPVAEKTEQDNVSSAKDAKKNLASDTSSYQGNDRGVVDKGEQETRDGLMEMPEAMEKSSDKETEIQLDQEEQKLQTSKPSGSDPMDELMAREAEAFRQRMQESIELGNRLLPVLAEYKAKIIKAKTEVVPAGSADPVRPLLQEVRPLINQLMEVKTFLDDYETPKVAKLLLGEFPREAEELRQRIDEFYEDYPF